MFHGLLDIGNDWTSGDSGARYLLEVSTGAISLHAFPQSHASVQVRSSTALLEVLMFIYHLFGNPAACFSEALKIPGQDKYRSKFFADLVSNVTSIDQASHTSWPK
jgi:hypothetical protein